MGISREIMEEVLKSLNIAPKVLARRSNTMLDILLATVKEAKILAGSILTSKLVRLQTVSGHMKDENHTSQGPLGDIQGPFGGLFCELWLS